MAASYIPLGVKEITDNVVVYATDITSAGTASTDWVVVPAYGTESKTYTNTNGDANGNPNGVTDNLSTTETTVSMIKIKADGNCYNSSKRVVHMHLKGVGKIIGHGYTGNANRGMVIAYKEYTKGMSETDFAKDSVVVKRTTNGGSYIVELDGLEATKEYIVSFYATGADNDFYAAELFVGTPCTDAGLALPLNPDIEINENEDIVAPELKNDNNVAVSYASSDESVVTVAADGTLTKVGAGEAVITISAARQAVGDVIYCADELTYNVKIKSLSPVLEATESALDFSLNAFETTKSATFTVSGYNLKGEASVSKLPDGFTLDPATLTIVDGAVEQAYTLTYNAEEAVETSNADLTFTVGETTVTIALTYGKKAPLSQTTVTDSTTWDWSKASATKEIKLTADTKPAKNDTILLADYDGINNTESFRSDALMVCGEYLIRDSKYFQGGYISFNAERKGFVTVNYTNTGSNAARSLVVNGTKDAALSSADSKTMVTSSKMSVNAGKVVIMFALTEDTTNKSQYARVYSVTYTVDNSGDIGSAFDQTQVETKAQKVIRDGQLLIIRDGKTYTAQGVQVQ